MNKAIKRHLLRKGVILAKRSDEPMTFTERAPDFFRWFSKSVMGFDSEEYRKRFWEESYKHGYTIGHIPYTLENHFKQKRVRSDVFLVDMLATGLLMGGSFMVWVLRRKIDQHIHRLRRPSYYETERMRRIDLTRERRRIRYRTTNNPRPSANALRDAFKHARDSIENMIRIGSLMEDLECYIDNSLVFNENGQIIARKGGIRRYIQSEIPDLYESYKTLMRYKALAKKFRQAVGISDPIPAASVLPAGDNPEDGKYAQDIKTTPNSVDNSAKCEKIYSGCCVENMVRTDSQGSKTDTGKQGNWSGENGDANGGGNRDANGGGNGDANGGGEGCGKENGKGRGSKTGRNSDREAGDSRLDDKIRRTVAEILAVCEGTFMDLESVLELHIGADTIPHRNYARLK